MADPGNGADQGRENSRQLEQTTEKFLREYYERYPQLAAQLGLHEFDGRVTDFRREAMDAWVDRLRDFRRRFGALDATGLTDGEQMDLDVLKLAIDDELMQLEVLERYRRNPMDYLWALDTTNYLKRDYAPLETRVTALIQHLGHVEKVLAAARANLVLPVPAPFIRVGIRLYEGATSYLENELPALAEGLGEESPDLAQALVDAQQIAVEALRSFTTYLEELREGGSSDGDYAIGAEAFAAMLRTGEGVDVSLERLLEIGEADLQKNRAAFEAMAAAIDPDVPAADVAKAMDRDHPRPGDLLAETRIMLDELRAWIEEHEIVTVPPGGQLLVEETPAFLRWAFAMMSSPGPFEDEADEAFYWVTPPESSWDDSRTEQWLSKFAYPKLWDVSIHEAWPGHYLHYLHFKGVKSRVRRIFTAYSFWEAWAHYSEQMMIEAGFRPDDLQLRLAQLAEALLRNVRYLAAIKMHTQDMSVEDATTMFMEHAHLEEGPARQEALRGTFDPGYLNYTLGKLMLLKLREDYRAARKAEEGSFSLREFHDKFLSYGAPPVPLVRKRMLGPDSGDPL